ncbi:MAG: hypothetical protein V4489_07445 [Chlamydiota bacterium]
MVTGAGSGSQSPIRGESPVGSESFKESRASSVFKRSTIDSGLLGRCSLTVAGEVVPYRPENPYAFLGGSGRKCYTLVEVGKSNSGSNSPTTTEESRSSNSSDEALEGRESIYVPRSLAVVMQAVDLLGQEMLKAGDVELLHTLVKEMPAEEVYSLSSTKHADGSFSNVVVGKIDGEWQSKIVKSDGDIDKGNFKKEDAPKIAGSLVKEFVTQFKKGIYPTNFQLENVKIKEGSCKIVGEKGFANVDRKSYPSVNKTAGKNNLEGLYGGLNAMTSSDKLSRSQGKAQYAGYSEKIALSELGVGLYQMAFLKFDRSKLDEKIKALPVDSGGRKELEDLKNLSPNEFEKKCRDPFSWSQQEVMSPNEKGKLRYVKRSAPDLLHSHTLLQTILMQTYNSSQSAIILGVLEGKSGLEELQEFFPKGLDNQSK